MKRIIILIASAGFVLLFTSWMVFRSLTRRSVIEHMSDAVEMYGGTALDALRDASCSNSPVYKSPPA